MVAGVSAQAALASRTRTMAFLIKDAVIRILHPAAGSSYEPAALSESAVTDQADPEIYGQSRRLAYGEEWWG
jgi:hypothetical protein